MARFTRGFDMDAAATHLGKRDRKFVRWIERIGPLPQEGWSCAATVTGARKVLERTVDCGGLCAVGDAP